MGATVTSLKRSPPPMRPPLEQVQKSGPVSAMAWVPANPATGGGSAGHGATATWVKVSCAVTIPETVPVHSTTHHARVWTPSVGISACCA